MTLEEGHIYEFESFRFKNGAAAKRKFLTVLKAAEDGSLVGVLATSNDAGCHEYLQGGDKGAVVSGNGVTVAWTIPPAEAVTSTGWCFTKPTFFYANQALYYSAHTIGGILDDSPRVIDRGALDPGVVEGVTRMVSQPEIGNQKSLLFLSGQMQTHLRRQMPRKVSDDLSMLGMSGAQKKALVENGIFLLENAALPGGAALLVHDEGTVTAISADGSRRIGTTSDLLKLRNQNLAKAMKEKPSGQAAAEAAFSEPERPDRFPPGTLKPYVQAESAVEWLRRHLGGGTAFDRKSLYHINIINSLIQHDKEIYKRIPSCRFSGLSEGGRRNVAASVILRAGKGPDREKYEDVRASGYTRSQELIGNWAERDGCWEDYAEKAQRDAGRELIGAGSEARVFKDDGGWCYKTIDAGHYGGSLEKLMDRISLHNAVFPETAMHVEGFGMHDEADDASGFVVTVRQPFVHGNVPDSDFVLEEIKRRDFRLHGEDAMKQVKDDAVKNGLKVPKFSVFFTFVSEDGVRMVDVNDLNAVVSPKGNLLVYDCDLDLHKDPGLGPVHQIPPVTFDEDAVRRIGGFLEDLVPQIMPKDAFLAMYGGRDLLKEQLEATGRYEGLIQGPFEQDLWLVQENPENADEVLLLPQRNAHLMLSIMTDGEFTAAERAAMSAGLSIVKDGRHMAFNLDKGRPDGYKAPLKLSKIKAVEAKETKKPVVGQGPGQGLRP